MKPCLLLTEKENINPQLQQVIVEANILTDVDSYFKTVKSYFWPVAFS